MSPSMAYKAVWRRKTLIETRGGHQYVRERPETAHATVAVTTTALHWAAGFIEGEGSFKGHSKRAGGKVQVTVFQVNAEPLERLLALFGGSIRNGKGGNIWSVAGTRGMGVALTLYPLMSKRRREQILKAIWLHKRDAERGEV